MGSLKLKRKRTTKKLKRARGSRAALSTIRKRSKLICDFQALDFVKALSVKSGKGYYIVKGGNVETRANGGLAWKTHGWRITPYVLEGLLAQQQATNVSSSVHSSSSSSPSSSQRRTKRFKSEWRPVLNNASHDFSQHGREQLQFKDCPRRMQRYIQHIARYIETLLSLVNEIDSTSEACDRLIYDAEHLVAKSQLLRSFSQSHEQVMHLDLAKNGESWLDLGKSQMLRDIFDDSEEMKVPPLSVLIPIHRPIELVVVEGSAQCIWYANDVSQVSAVLAMRNAKKSRRKIICVEVGQIIFFRQDLIHAGAGYEEENVRLHMYIDSKHEEARDPDLITLMDK